jgi:hypothetical protein
MGTHHNLVELTGGYAFHGDGPPIFVEDAIELKNEISVRSTNVEGW